MPQHEIRFLEKQLYHGVQFSAFLHGLPVCLKIKKLVHQQSQVTINIIQTSTVSHPTSTRIWSPLSLLGAQKHGGWAPRAASNPRASSSKSGNISVGVTPDLSVKRTSSVVRDESAVSGSTLPVSTWWISSSLAAAGLTAARKSAYAPPCTNDAYCWADCQTGKW